MITTLPPICVFDVPESWRFFDNLGASGDRYSIWQDDGYLACSSDPFWPQGICLHVDGSPPDCFDDDERLEALGEELLFSELPSKVQRAVLQDVRRLLEAENQEF